MYTLNASERASLTSALETAVADASRWSDVCDVLAQIFGGIGTVLIPIDPDQRGPWLVHSATLIRSLADYVAGGWHKHDNRQLGVPMMREHGVVADLDFTEPSTIQRSPYYTRFLADHGLGGFVGLYFTAGEAEWCASIQRGPDKMALSARDLALAEEVRPLLQAAVDKAHAASMAHFDLWQVLLTAHDRGMSFIDRSGRVRVANDNSQTFHERFGIFPGGVVTLPGERAQAQFKQMLAQAIDPGYTGPLLAPVMLPPKDGVSLVVELARMPPWLQHFTLDVVALVMLREASLPSANTEEWLARRHGLVPSEIRAAMGIASGRSPRQIAGSLGLADGTVRQQLKAVYRKVGVNSQVQLAALLNAQAGDSPTA